LTVDSFDNIDIPDPKMTAISATIDSVLLLSAFVSFYSAGNLIYI